MSVWCCPICGAGMHHQEKSLVCQIGHTFDFSRSGYVHLLPVNQKRTKNPGDNGKMIHARRDFLNAGYYVPLCEKLCMAVAESFPVQGGILLDAGCGEGYYTQHVAQTLEMAGKQAHIYGVDIAKCAVDAAAKRCKDISFAVGSVFHLPVTSNCCDLLISLFAPYCGTEFYRVLKKQGKMILVIPGSQHLMGLKEAIYDQPYPNVVRDYQLDGFSLLRVDYVEDTILLKNETDIRNLFMMTPYYYKTGRNEHARLEALKTLRTQISFEILQYQKEV